MLFHYIGADIIHLLAVIVLLARILNRKSCADISAKCQLLLAVSFTLKSLYTFSSKSYNFLFYHFASRLFFIAFSYVLTILVYFAFKNTRRAEEDSFATELLVVPAFLLSLYFNIGLTSLDVTWEFGTYLEGLAVMPQFYMIYRSRRIDNSMFIYLLAIFFYKFFYNFGLISMYCEDGVKLNVSLGFLQLALESVVSIGAFAVLVSRGVNMFGEQGRLEKNSFELSHSCPYSKTCRTPRGCRAAANLPYTHVTPV